MSGIFEAIIGSVIGGGGAAATTAAASTAATTATAAKTVTLSKILSTGSALMAIGQGIAASSAARTQAAFAEAEAEQELAAGASKARDLAREYAELRGEQTAIQLANGLDVGVGTPVTVGEATKRQAQRNLDVTRQTARNRAAMSRLRARGLMSEARMSLLRGFGAGGERLLSGYQLTG